jgi:hypothetical protein
MAQFNPKEMPGFTRVPALVSGKYTGKARKNIAFDQQ